MNIEFKATYKEKNAENKKWYKDWALHLINLYNSDIFGYNKNLRLKIKVNYDLFNNKLNMKDFEYVCKPYGNDNFELPAKMENRDISSPKIKALLGMEVKRPFVWKVFAVNPEATNRKERKLFEKLKEFVISQIMQPIQEEIQQKMAQQMQMLEQQANKIPPEQIQQMAQQMQQQGQQELEQKTPEEIKMYIQREYQDPAEILSSQLLQYLKEELELQKVFNNGFKDLLISGYEIYYINSFNKKLNIWRVNPMDFYCKLSKYSNKIEDAEYVVALYHLTPTEIIKLFGNELTKKEIDKIYDMYNDQVTLFQHDNEYYNVPVYHCVWRSLRKVKFLTYIDEDNEVQEIIVDDEYTLNTEAGDVAIEEIYVPEVYETWVIGRDIFVNMQPVPGQFLDVQNVYESKLPYFGIIMDNENSEPVSLMDRLRPYQYLYNIVIYRLELLLASDKGKKILMNISALPKESGIDLEKWQKFFETTPIMWFDSSEEGTTYQDANTVARYIDLSLASDINKYIQLAEYIRREAGRSIGITELFEGNVEPRVAVSNVKQGIIQSSYITEGYFYAHDNVKKNVLTFLLNQAKYVYSYGNSKKLQYVLDDMSYDMLSIDPFILENNTFGVFVSNNSALFEQQELIKQLAHAALQNQLISFSDLIKILKQDNIAEAEEIIRKGEIEAQKRAEEMKRMEAEFRQRELEMKRKMDEEKHQQKINEIMVTAQENRKTELLKMALIGYSFNPEIDKDKNRQNDFLELFNILSQKETDWNALKEKIYDISLLKNRIEGMNNNQQTEQVTEDVDNEPDIETPEEEQTEPVEEEQMN